MNRKELQEWLHQFPEETIIEIVFHQRGLGYYDQGGNATTDIFNPEVDEYGYNRNGHFYHNSGYNTLLLGGHDE